MSGSRDEKGQATTEVVLLLPMFMFFLFAFAKVFALLILVQKLQIASFYAARRWQLQSHRNASCESFDNTVLQPAIQDRVCTYLGYAGGCSVPNPNFLDLGTHCVPSSTCSNSVAPGVSIQRTQVWNVVTTTVCTNPVNLVFYKTQGFTFC
ncbi:MAG TPA: hypothetical protein VH309_07665, partial [Elusimicrobiota bacterium]|nr:hypothetical protein [Elusimicrobiota bacterium]